MASTEVKSGQTYMKQSIYTIIQPLVMSYLRVNRKLCKKISNLHKSELNK